jgi:predicted TIM-barrel fold metal-dependent hydrolase
MPGFKMFDADQHYYEAEDCLTRFASDRMKNSKFVRWMTEADGKRKRMFLGGREANVIGNPTFNPVAAPGVYHQTLKQLDVAQDRSALAFGQLEPIRQEYRDREVRLKTMDEQGVDKTLLFPTLGVTLEGFADDDVQLQHDTFHAFNRWLEEDWGFAYRGRMFAAPYIVMREVGLAIEELEWVLGRGARLITIRPGPAYGRSPADPYFDPFWARVEEAGVLVTYHAFEGPSLAHDAFRRQWAAPPKGYRREDSLLEHVLAGVDTAIMDTLCALVLHNLFGRFPKLKVATIEMGCGWVPYLMYRLDRAGGLLNRKISAFGGTLDAKPSEIFKRHVWVAPFPEEDVPALVGQVGAERVLMGSDWPHAEAVPQPRDYLDCLTGIGEADRRAILHDNISGLIEA